MADKRNSLISQLSSAQTNGTAPTGATTATVGASGTAEVLLQENRSRSASQSFSQNYNPAHKRETSFLNRLEQLFTTKDVSLSLRINSTIIVDQDKPGEEDPPYTRLYTGKNHESLISTKKVWSPPVAVIFYTDKPNGSAKHLESPLFPIAINITKSNIKFPPEVMNNINGKKGKVKMYFVVQTGGNGQSLHCEQAFFNNKQVQELEKTQPSSMNTPHKVKCKIEIFSTNPKIKCENAKTTVFQVTPQINASQDASNLRASPQNSAPLELKNDTETTTIPEVSYCCYFAAKIRTESSPVVIDGLDPTKTEHFVSKITSQNDETIITYHWIVPPEELLILNYNICSPFFSHQRSKLLTLMEKFESFKEETISQVGIPDCHSFLREPFETLKKYLEFQPIKNIKVPAKQRLRSPSFSPSFSTGSHGSDSASQSDSETLNNLPTEPSKPNESPIFSRRSISTGSESPNGLLPKVSKSELKEEVLIRKLPPPPIASRNSVTRSPLRDAAETGTNKKSAGRNKKVKTGTFLIVSTEGTIEIQSTLQAQRAPQVQNTLVQVQDSFNAQVPNALKAEVQASLKVKVLNPNGQDASRQSKPQIPLHPRRSVVSEAPKKETSIEIPKKETTKEILKKENPKSPAKPPQENPKSPAKPPEATSNSSANPAKEGVAAPGLTTPRLSIDKTDKSRPAAPTRAAPRLSISKPNSSFSESRPNANNAKKPPAPTRAAPKKPQSPAPLLLSIQQIDKQEREKAAGSSTLSGSLSNARVTKGSQDGQKITSKMQN